MKIETATIRRLRDALLKSGRRQAEVVSSAYQTLARAGILTDDEREAVARVSPVAETMFLMMSADGKITVSERDAMRGAIRGLTGDVLQDGTIEVLIESYQRTVQAEGREARLRAIADALADHPADAEGAFALAAAVALADDDVAAEERELVNQMGIWFGISPDRASSILDELEEEKSE